MPDLARINQPRVDKALGFIELIAKSARSTKATEEERARLLAPIVDAVEAVAPSLFGDDETDEKETGAVERAPVSGYDREAIKDAYLRIAEGDVVFGLRDLRSVILGWRPKEETEN